MKFLRWRGWVVVSPFWTRLFSVGRADGVLVFPFILLARPQLRTQATFINHERIHFTQAMELAVIPFYALYFLEFIWNFIRFANFYKAYRAISFEKEAYQNQNDLDYLQQRPLWAFRNYYSQNLNY